MLRNVLYLTILVSLILSACGGGNDVAVTEPPVTKTVAPATRIPPTATLRAVTLTPTSIPPTNSPDCTNRATFIADVSIPDNTKFDARSRYTKTWRVSNSGTCAWNSNYSMAFASGYQMDAPDSVPLAYTAPGDTLDVSVDLTAPDKQGTANSFFELHNPAGVRMPIDTGVYLYVTIYVNPSVSLAAGAPTSTSNTTSNASVSVGTTGAAITVTSGGCTYSIDPAKVVEAIGALNSYRLQKGLSPLTVNPLLTQAALGHSADMACKNLFGHAGSDGSTAATRVAAAGYAASGVAENVYGSYPPLSGGGVISWWANDQTDLRHNANLLTTKYSEVGVAYAFSNNFGYYVIDFASP